MLLMLTIMFFVLGLIIGSFLNVVILRFNTHKSFGGRSACMVCQNTLAWYDLIPLFSFMTLNGRCRTCSTRISLQYPVVELSAGLIYALLFVKFQSVFLAGDVITFAVTYAFYAVIFSILLVISVYDLKHRIIPDSLSFVFGLISFIGIFFFSNFSFAPHIPNLIELCSGLLVAAPFAFFWLVSSGRWMGFGDAKLALGLGWCFGLGVALSGVVIAFWIGAVVGVVLMLFQKNKYGMKTEIPFAPFLVLGACIAFILELHLFLI